MSEPAVRAELHVTLKDGTTAGLKAIEQQAERSARKVAEASASAAKKSASETESSTSRQRASYERLSHAREVLGVRSERSIQREIQQTEAAYKRLESSGTLSQQTLARAAEKTREKITRLTNEMGKLTAEQKKATQEAEKFEKINSRLRTGVAVGAGVAAAGYTLSGPAKAAMSLDERIGLLSNTAFAERDAAGRKLGDAQILKAIKESIGTGMTIEASMDALEKLINDNQVGGVSGALDLLPYIGKVSTGSGSGSRDVAAMMGGFIGSGYAKDVDGAKRMMALSSAAATAGAFEKKDMAKHLPELLPLAKAAGLTGEQGFKKLLVLLQQSRTTSGSSDEAAINVKNFLTKVASNDTATDFKKAGRGDLYKHLMDQRAKGIDPVTAWQNIIDSEIDKNPNLKPAIANVQNAKTKEEQDAAIESLKGMAEGQSIGKFFQDMQAKGAVFGMRNKEVEKKVDDSLRLSGTIVETDYESIADRAGVKTRIAGERADMAKYDVMDKATPAIGKAAELFGDLAAKFPLMTGATVLATTALTAMAGAAGLATLVTGGGKDSIARTGQKYLPMASNAGGFLGKAAGADLAWNVGYDLVGKPLARGIDSLVQWGTGNQNQNLGGWIYDLMNSPTLKPPEQQKMKAEVDISVKDDRAQVKSVKLTTSGNLNATMNTGNMWGIP